MPSENCPHCKELLDRASTATRGHLDALGRLQIATIRNDRDLISECETAVCDARLAREEATAAYQAHERSHRSMEVG